MPNYTLCVYGMTGTGLFVRYNGTKHAVGYGQTFNIGDITIRAIPVNFEIYSSKFQARNSSSILTRRVKHKMAEAASE